MKNTPFTRRRFLGSMLLAGVAPIVLPSRLFGATAPSNMLRIGVIGTGRMGFGNMTAALASAGDTRSRIVAVSDPNLGRARLAKGFVEERSREYFPEGSVPDVAVFQDYREMLETTDLDGVILSTPDFAHFFPALDCVNKRIGIYIEKPLTYSIREGQALVKAVRQNNAVLQVGSQQRSSVHFHRVCWLVRNGRIGKIQRIHVQLPPDSGQADFVAMDVPENLDYDLWQGPTKPTPYTEARVQARAIPQDRRFTRPGWLQVEQYCLGMMTGWGAHMFDIAQWGMGTDLDSGPVEFSATGEFPDRGVFDVHTAFKGEARYENGVIMTSQTGDHVVRFEGEDGWLSVARGKFDAHDREILREVPEGGIELATSKNHMRNFLECLRSGEDPVASVEAGHRSNTVCVLNHMAMKLGRKIRWDPVAEAVIDDPEASAMLHYDYRDGYTLPA